MDLPANVSKGQSISAINTNIAFNAIRSLSMQVQALGQYQRSTLFAGSSCDDVVDEIETDKETIANILRPLLAQPFEIYPEVKHIKCNCSTEEFYNVSIKMKNGYILWDKYKLIKTADGFNINPTEANYGFLREVKVGQALMRFASEEDILLVSERKVPYIDCQTLACNVYISAVLRKGEQEPCAEIYVTEGNVHDFKIQSANKAKGGDGYGELCVEMVDTQIPLAGFHLWFESNGEGKPLAIKTEITQLWRGNMYAKSLINADTPNRYSEQCITILQPTTRVNESTGGIGGFVVVDQNWTGAVEWKIDERGCAQYCLID